MICTVGACAEELLFEFNFLSSCYHCVGRQRCTCAEVVCTNATQNNYFFLMEPENLLPFGLLPQLLTSPVFMLMHVPVKTNIREVTD